MIELNMDNFQSDVQARFYSSDDERILQMNLSGTIRTGSDGSVDVNKLFIQMTGYYFWIEPHALLIDLRELQYTYGNSIFRVLHFLNTVARSEYEKNLPLAFVVSDKNEKGLCRLLNVSKGALPQQYFDEYDKALVYLESTLEAD